MRQRGIEETLVAPSGDPRRQGGSERADIGHHRDIERHAPAQRAGVTIDLDDLRVLGKEIAIGKVAAQHQQRIAFLQRVIARRKPDQPGHPDIVWVVPLHIFLTAQRMHDRCLERARQGDHRVMRPCRSRTGQDRHTLGTVEQHSGRVERRRVGREDGHCGWREGRHLALDLQQRHVARQNDHRHASLADRRAQRPVQHCWHLLRIGHHLAKMAALAEQLGRVCLLKVVEPNLARRQVTCDRQHRHPTALTVEQAVDQM